MSRMWHKMKRRLRLLEEERRLPGSVASLKERHARELERRTEKVNSLLEKIATTRWSPDHHGSYCVQVSMNPDVLGGVSMYRDDLRFLAEVIGRQVEREISSGHFVKAAYQTEYDSLPRMWRVPQ